MSDRTGSGLENGIAGARNTNERTFHIRITFQPVPSSAVAGPRNPDVATDFALGWPPAVPA
jgi:hypothetical protein